ESGFAVKDRLWRPSHSCGNHWYAEKLGFQSNIRTAFQTRREQSNLSCQQKGRDIFTPAKQLDVLSHPLSPDDFRDSRFHGSPASQQNPKGRTSPAHSPDHIEEQLRLLLLGQTQDSADHAITRRQTQSRSRLLPGCRCWRWKRIGVKAVQN